MKKFMLTVAVLALLAPAVPAQTPSHDYTAIKLQTDIFESVLNTALKQSYTGNVMLLSPPKGTYLDGYGAVFTLEVNLATMRYITPFASAPYSDKEIKDARAQKIARTKEVEEMIKGLIRGNGAGLNFLKPDENLAVVVHLFNTADHRGLPTQLVVQAKKQALDKPTVVLY
jgi:hypothetical protein